MKTYTIKQVCDILQISKTTFYAWKNSGKIKVIKLSDNVVRVTHEELERLLNKGE